MNVACLLLAAGGSSRFGGRKQLASVEGQPMIQRALEQLTPVFNQEVYTVIGAYRNEVSPLLAGRCHVIEHLTWNQGLGSSIKTGVNTIIQQSNYDGILIALADQVRLMQSDYSELLSRFDGTTIIAAHYCGKNAVPALFPTRFFSELQNLNGDSGARCLLDRYCNSVTAVPLPQAETDIDTKQDLIQLTTNYLYLNQPE
ncbi:nucleotidyltransferase family protein [Aliamphritea spongicola]|uniref:nucleotidyltransferase family protein n=1 Tax=Aliamphritea spongicola TaxID=707589 RepID=UPI00196A4EBD|nr:nucleotidyltransferase family protein [Aliamphritea spongicola]MBN3562836.1 nucleotidyltransferase family protein [Aliamphritea spongicola]